MLKGYIISLINNHDATVATRLLIESIEKTQSQVDPVILPATTPDTIEEHLEQLGMKDIKYTYPMNASQDGVDINTGLRLTHYETKNIKARIACMVSHMRCWQTAIDTDETIVVLEHDALFKRKFDFSSLTKYFKGGIMGLNSPIGATRRAYVFDELARKIHGVQSVPYIDEKDVPQGLAGNSAYVITPKGAKRLLDKVREIGMWPNDALMNRQFFPWMQIVYPYYTEVQKGLKSTTTQ